MILYFIFKKKGYMNGGVIDLEIEIRSVKTVQQFQVNECISAHRTVDVDFKNMYVHIIGLRNFILHRSTKTSKVESPFVSVDLE